jgi:ABC-2 type transport system ATP-binding protein
MRDIMSTIQVEGLKKYYGRHRGLESATFEVNQGEIFGFVGPNGAGKTTLIRLLLGLIHKTGGTATIFDHDIEANNAILNKSIGYLPSEAFFFPEMSVAGVLEFYQKMRKIDSTKVAEMTKRFELDPTKKVEELSFGNKKKLGIVIALMHEPKLLILDEPTTGLDPLMQQIFLDTLLEEKKKGVTIFLSSHILSEVEKICDRVAIIRDGVVNQVFEMNSIKQFEHKVVYLQPTVLDSKIQGLKLVSEANGNGTYDYHGNIDFLIKELAKYSLTNVTIRDASLEEIFIKYYQKEVL